MDVGEEQAFADRWHRGSLYVQYSRGATVGGTGGTTNRAHVVRSRAVMRAHKRGSQGHTSRCEAGWVPPHEKG